MPKTKKSQKEININFLPEEIQEKINKVFDTYFGFGYYKYKRPEKESSVIFPNKISSMKHTEVRDLHGEYESFLSYTRDKLKYYIVAENVVKKETELAYNRAMAGLRDAKGNIESKKAEAKIDEGYLALLDYKEHISSIISMLRIDEEKFVSNSMSMRAELKARELNTNF